jgi:hypothetical protein
MDPDSKERLRLVQLEHPVEYVALSYCWGNSQEKTKTVRENLGARLKKVDDSQLPQTIKDAVKVARSLKLGYLWVDALCIVQDDDYDCAKELAKMSDIYYGASLTISAASAERSSEGFLGDRALSKAYGGVLFSLRYEHGRDDDIVTGRVFLSKQPIRDKNEEPIDRRGWTMQEHILSRRVLRFGSKQTTWKCLSRHYSLDGGGSPHPMNEDVALAIHEVHRRTEVQSRMKEFDGLNRSVVLGNWKRQMEKYSDRKITKLNDKLPACAALAQNFAYIMGWEPSEYLAGLWEKDIYEQLLWYQSDKSGLPDFPQRHGPTWSWASLAGPFRFLEWEQVKNLDHSDAQAELMDVDIDLKNKCHPYSEVLSGRLKLNGRLQRVYWDKICLRQGASCSHALPLRIYWDLSRDNSDRYIWCLEIFASHGVRARSVGLVLERKDLSEFERLGIFQVSDGILSGFVHDWFCEVEKRTITLC